MFKPDWKFILVGCAWFLTATLGRAADEQPKLAIKLSDVAERILQVTPEAKVGQFRRFGPIQAESGLGIEATLRDELERAKPGCVKEGAAAEVSGEYQYLAPVADGGPKIVKFTIEVKNVADGSPLIALPGIVVECPEPEIVIDTVQPTVPIQLPAAPVPPPEVVLAKVQRAIEKPACWIHGPDNTKVSSDRISPYAVQILAGSDSEHLEPRSATNQNGMAYVELEQGEVYEIYCYNSSPLVVGAKVTVDGVNTYHFCEPKNALGYSRLTRWIIKPDGEGYRIPGFVFSMPDDVRAFLVTGPGDGVHGLAGLETQGQTGVIHVQFFEALKRDHAEEPPVLAKKGLETKPGQKVNVILSEKSYDFGSLPLDSVCIRYSR